MKKESVIIFVIAGILAGFVAGVWTGIRFASKEEPEQAELVIPAQTGKTSSEEIQALEQLLGRDPSNLQALIDLGNRYFDLRVHQKAIDAYTRALKIDPGNADVRTDMAVMYREIKDYDRAVKELKEAARTNPRHVNSRYNLGIILLHDKNDPKGAAAAWEDCLRAGASGEQAEKIRRQLSALKELSG